MKVNTPLQPFFIRGVFKLKRLPIYEQQVLDFIGQDGKSMGGLFVVSDGTLQIRQKRKRIYASNFQVSEVGSTEAKISFEYISGEGYLLRFWLHDSLIAEIPFVSTTPFQEITFSDDTSITWQRRTFQLGSGEPKPQKSQFVFLRAVAPYDHVEGFEDCIPDWMTACTNAFGTGTIERVSQGADGIPVLVGGGSWMVKASPAPCEGEFPACTSVVSTEFQEVGDYEFFASFYCPSSEGLTIRVEDNSTIYILDTISIDPVWATTSTYSYTVTVGANIATSATVDFFCPTIDTNVFYTDNWTVYNPNPCTIPPIPTPTQEPFCMPELSTDRIGTQRHRRNFIQFGGPRPLNPVKFSGQDAQYLVIQGVSKPISGGIDPIWVPDFRRAGEYQLVNRSITPADLPTAEILMLESHGSIPRTLGKIGCAFNLYENVGNCKDLSDFNGGWSDFVVIYSGGLVTDVGLGDRSAWDTDDKIEDSLSVTFSDIYGVSSLSFGEKATTLIDREVVDIVYGSNVQCGECGVSDDGTSWIYAITKSSGSGSPGLPAELIYTTDGGATWNEANITNIGASEDPVAIDIVGNYILILSRTAGSATSGGYYYATINAATGVPSTFTKVTTGFVNNKQPNDLWVSNPREIYFAADDGYIYKSTDITGGVSVISEGEATSQDLYRIHGKDSVIVAVGASSTVIRTTNGGASWSATADNPADIPLDVRAVLVLDSNRYWVGTTDSGRVYFTLNGGETWTQKEFSGAGSGGVYDIVAATDEVLYFSHSTSTPTARIFTSWNGGANFTNAAPRLQNLPTFNRANRLAVPLYVSDKVVAANNLAIGGLGAGGTDGILAIGVARVL